MKTITVFTPTYNRAEKLIKLYYSLVAQTSKNFVWLIVDDGSCDNTYYLVEQWIQNNKINIVYIKQPNQGKHIAMEKAFEMCRTQWLICVDSDDVLSNDAIEKMNEDIEFSDCTDIIGFIYPRKFNSKDYIQYSGKEKYIDIMDAKNLYGIKETAILLKTEILRNVKFPNYKNEKFLSEEIIYIELEKYGKVLIKNRYFYISEYQADGLTKNLFNLWKENPYGTIRLFNDRFLHSNKYKIKARIFLKMKAILNLNGLCISCKISIIENTPSKLWSFALFLPSIVWAKMRFVN